MTDVLSESRFNKPSLFCPHPEYWHSPDSEATEIEVSEFIAALVRVIQPELVVETGTWYGYTTWQIILALIKNGHGRLETVENYAEAYTNAKIQITSLGYEIGKTLEELPVNLIFQNTMEYVPSQKIDFAFLDSWQLGRAQEFRRFRDMGLLLPGTFVAIHDTAPHHMVLETVMNLEKDGLFKSLYFNTPRGLALGQVTG